MEERDRDRDRKASTAGWGERRKERKTCVKIRGGVRERRDGEKYSVSHCRTYS